MKKVEPLNMIIVIRYRKVVVVDVVATVETRKGVGGRKYASE